MGVRGSLLKSVPQAGVLVLNPADVPSRGPWSPRGEGATGSSRPWARPVLADPQVGTCRRVKPQVWPLPPCPLGTRTPTPHGHPQPGPSAQQPNQLPPVSPGIAAGGRPTSVWARCHPEMGSAADRQGLCLRGLHVRRPAWPRTTVCPACS